jgi:hypothetical protein
MKAMPKMKALADKLLEHGIEEWYFHSDQYERVG